MVLESNPGLSAYCAVKVLTFSGTLAVKLLPAGVNAGDSETTVPVEVTSRNSRELNSASSCSILVFVTSMVYVALCPENGTAFPLTLIVTVVEE